MMENDGPEYLVDRILPSGRVHLLAGISSSGKSRFLIPSLIMWAAGLPVLGLKSWPVPWCVVCGDRPIRDAEDTIRGIGFQPSDVDLIPAFGQYNKPVYQIMEEVKARGAKLVLWEGFDFAVRQPNNPHEVREFLSTISAHCEAGCTVIGTVGVAKLKPREMYQNPRQLVAGSSVWERATSTNLIIVAVNPKDIADPRRLLYVSLKNSPSFAVAGEFDDNGFLTFDNWNDPRGTELILSWTKNGKHR